MKLARNFDSAEFDVHEPWPAGYESERQQLANLAQWFRDLAGCPAWITSAYRSPEHNSDVHGAKDSQHMRAQALDLTFVGITDRELTRRLLDAEAAGTAPNYGQFIVYTDTTHVHISLGARRQKLIATRNAAGARVYETIAAAKDVPIGAAEPVVLLSIAGAGVLLWVANALVR